MYTNLKNQIKKNIDSLAPDVLANINDADNRRVYSEAELFGELSDSAHPQRINRLWYGIGGVVVTAVIMLALMINVIIPSDTVVASIFIDVNPCVELQVDADNKVSNVIALNDDGRAILQKFKLKEKDTSLVMVQIIELLREQNYLSAEDDNVLVTYYYIDRKMDINEVSDKCTRIMEEKTGKHYNLICQEVVQDDNIMKSAKDLGISPGKYTYIKKCEKGTKYNDKQLASMNVNDICKLVKSSKQEEVIATSKPETSDADKYVSETLKEKESEIITETIAKPEETAAVVIETTQVENTTEVTTVIMNEIVETTQEVETTVGVVSEETSLVHNDSEIETTTVPEVTTENNPNQDITDSHNIIFAKKIKNIKVTKKGKIIVLFRGKVDYAPDMAVSIVDSKGQNLNLSIVKKGPRRIILKPENLQEERYTIYLENIKGKRMKHYITIAKSFDGKTVKNSKQNEKNVEMNIYEEAEKNVNYTIDIGLNHKSEMNFGQEESESIDFNEEESESIDSSVEN